MNRSYTRFFSSESTLITKEQIVGFFEKFNEIEYVDFFEDLFTNDAYIARRLNFPDTDSNLAYCSSFLKKLSGFSKENISRALESTMTNALKSSAHSSVTNSLYLIRILGIKVNKKVLKLIITDRTISAKTRFSASMILSEMQTLFDIRFWEAVDFQSYPELMPAALNFYSKYSPTNSLQLLNVWDNNRLENLSSFKRAVEKTMAFASDRSELKSIFKELKTWIINLILTEFKTDELLNLAEEAKDTYINESDFKIYIGKKITNESNPCVYDILTNQQIIPEYGFYLNSAQQFPPTPFTSEWQTTYINNVAKLFKDNMKDMKSKSIEVIDPLPPTDHDYKYIVNRIHFDNRTFRRRTNLPLEIMFDHPYRKEKIKVIPLFNVTHFAMLYYADSLQNRIFRWSSADDFDLSFNDWLDAISKPVINHDYLKICTQSDTIMDYVFKDATGTSKLKFFQVETRSNAGELGDWLYKHAAEGIVACDVGIAYQALEVMKKNGIPGELKIAFILYEDMTSAGFAYRNDDEIYGSICNQAMKETMELVHLNFSDSWENTLKNAAQLKLEPFDKYLRKVI